MAMQAKKLSTFAAVATLGVAMTTPALAIDDTIRFGGEVDSVCTLALAGNAGVDPIPYENTDDAQGHTVVMNANGTSKFDCNTPDVNLVITMASDIDVPAPATTNHEVTDVAVDSDPGVMLAVPVLAESAGDPVYSNAAVDTDSVTRDLSVTVYSEITPDGTDELEAGDYLAEVNVAVTAN